MAHLVNLHSLRLHACTLQMVLREAALHSVLSHPNILIVYNWELKQLGGGQVGY